MRCLFSNVNDFLKIFLPVLPNKKAWDFNPRLLYISIMLFV
jgi:hypothetical protein